MRLSQSLEELSEAQRRQKGPDKVEVKGSMIFYGLA